MFDISFNGMGLFATSEEWIHPARIEETYELIYVINGTVKIREGENYLFLKKGDLVLLTANTLHEGFEPSDDNPSFYWLHFYSEKLDLPQPFVTSTFRNGYIFKEMNHFDNLINCPEHILDSYTAYIVSTLIMEKLTSSGKNKLADEIYEWTRVNARAGLTVNAVAEHFGYNPEHISRIMRKSYSKSLKSIIDIFIINRAKELLNNTNMYVSEIAEVLGFGDHTAFIAFFKYHEKTTPTRYRNMYSKTHMNKK